MLVPSLTLFVVSAWASGLVLPIPKAPPANVSQYLARDFASFSIEFAFFPTFMGNLSVPNTLSLSLLNQITSRTGVPPSFRPGGITVDSSIYDPTAPALTTIDSATGGIYRTIYGPDYFQSLSVLSPQTEFVFGLNFGNNTLEIALKESMAAFANIPASQLWGFELGNEPDQYNANQRNVSTWGPQAYADEWDTWTSAIQSALGIKTPNFVAGGFAEDPTSSALITTAEVVMDGITNASTVKVFSQHMYQYSTCDPVRNAIATLPNLINHQNITAYVDEWIPQIAAAHSVGVPLIIGEFNSVSCSGKANVTDTFGQALWIADTMLYGASLNISKMFLHQGATLVLQSSDQANTPGFSHYNTWFPAAANGTGPAHASPSFVAFLLLGEAIGASNRTRIAPIATPSDYTQTLGAYAIWDDALRASWEGPARIVLLNMDIYNTTATDPRPSLTVDLSALVSEARFVELKRMTAPGLDEQDATLVTWAGQQYNNGSAVGRGLVEVAHSTDIEVRASEGVLVFLA